MSVTACRKSSRVAGGEAPVGAESGALATSSRRVVMAMSCLAHSLPML